MLKRLTIALSFLLMIVMMPRAVWAMHIGDGFLPPQWCISWGALSIPFVVIGLYSIQKTVRQSPKLKMLIAMAGAFAFVLSALKIPSVDGSSSHPTGVGLGAILFGPSVMSVLGLIVLLFQAFLLTHGGLSTLGANVFSMAVVGPITAFAVYKTVKMAKGPQWLAVFLGAALGNLLTYVTASVQLALAFAGGTGEFFVSLSKFLSVFALTQIPLAISEGILTVLMFNTLSVHSRDELKELNVISREV